MVDKAWMHSVFGKDWFYRLFLAFGCVTQGMVNCVNDVARAKKEAYYESEHAQAATQGNLDKLSARSRAMFLDEPVPEVRGVNHQRSAPYMARLMARLMTYQYRSRQATAWDDHRAGRKAWTQASKQEDDEEWRAMQSQWDYAEKISRESGFEFYDRHGNRLNVGVKPSIVADVVKLFLSKHGSYFKHLNA